jgi:predicted outer membrane repeat protein
MSFLLLSSILLLGGCTDFLWGTPQALFTCSHSSCYPYQQVEFDASGCLSEKDEIIEYSWNFSDGASASGTKVQHTFTTPGDYPVCLTITTEHGQEASVTHTVHVAEALLVPAAYKTIQAAIDAAKDGEVIIVLPGTYNENLRFRGENITVQSSDPDDVGTVSATIIRGKEYGRPTVNFGEDSRSTLAGFTVLAGPLPPNGTFCSACTGSIYIREASPIIRANRIINSPNTGIAIYESRAHIKGNVISNNTGIIPGGGIYIDSLLIAPIIVGNTFENNTAPSGGAIFITATTLNLSPACAAETIVRENVFRNNVAMKYSGGAIFVEYTGNLKFDTPDSNTYSGNDPDDIFYVVPPSE